MNLFQFSNLITLKDDDWLERQRVAGKCVGKVLRTLNEMIVTESPGLSLRILEKEAESIILSSDCTATFQGFKGFPGVLCLSVNKEMVHGIPSEYVLQKGDVVKFDVGATYKGAIADAAGTAIYGEVKSKIHIDLVNACKESLNKGIEAVKVGRQIGVIGNAIHKYAKSKGFSLPKDYGGHGIDENSPHAPPFVPNKADVNDGVRIAQGLSIAIEPMLIIGDNRTRIAKDGWTVLADDICAHFEHSIFVHKDSVEVLTKWE